MLRHIAMRVECDDDYSQLKQSGYGELLERRCDGMSESILTAKPSIFPCPNCGQMIYSSAETCRFCSTPVDHEVASLGAELQTRVNTACNHAKLLRNSAGVMWIFFLLGLLPFMPFGWGFT